MYVDKTAETSGW